MSKTTPLFRRLFVVATFPLAITAAGESLSQVTVQSPTPMTSPMRIRITINGTVLSGQLLPNSAAKDFAAMLPLTLELEDYNATEKIAQLPKKLSTADAPEGFTPTVGDIAFYAPWGNLAIFYKGFGYSKGLIKLGKIQGDIEILRKTAPQRALIEME